MTGLGRRGFTLIEVTIVMAVSALLIAAAITGVGAVRDGNTSTAQVDELKNKIEVVRAEAISGVTGTGTGQSTSTVFGKILEFDPATPDQIRVSSLLQDDLNPEALLSRCEEAPLQIGGGMQYVGDQRQAIIFTRQPDRTFTVRGNYPETTSNCPQTTYTQSALETGQDDPPPPPTPPGPPAGGAPPPPTTPTAPNGVRKPVWQLWNNVISHHEYTTSTAERDQKVNSGGYVLQNGGNPIGYVYSTQAEGSVALYRLFHPNLTATFLTTDVVQRNIKLTQGYNLVGIEGYILPQVYSGSIPLFQVYSSTYPDYYYSQDYNSIVSAKLSFRQYSDEQIVGYLLSHPIGTTHNGQPAARPMAVTTVSPDRSLISSILQLFGVGQAHAAFVFSNDILNPANYSLDNNNLNAQIQFDFRFAGETGGRTGTIQVNPRNNQITRSTSF